MALHNRNVKVYELPVKGINLSAAIELLAEGESLSTKNFYYRRGLRQKEGSQKLSSNRIDGDSPITGLHRFYYNTIDKVLIGAADDKISRYDDSLGTWTDLLTGRTATNLVNMVTWGALNRMYIADGTNLPKYIDSSLAIATVAGAPTTTYMFLPYRDRLLSVDKTNPSYIRWSASFSDATWEALADAIRMSGSGSIKVLKLHALAETNTGINAQVFAAKPTSCALFSATDLDPASAGYDARLDDVSSEIGCISPFTVINTPIGTIFLGSDRQVYLLQYGSIQLIPIGAKIKSTTLNGRSLLDINLQNMEKAAAVWENNIYKLTIPIGANSYNTIQFWLDTSRGLENLAWYGPMEGMELTCFVHQNGEQDNNKLIGGGNNGYVYSVNEIGIYSDDGTAISSEWHGRPQAWQNTGLDTRIFQVELELTDPLGTVTLAFNDTVGAVGDTINITGTGSGVFYGVYYYGEVYYTASGQLVRILKQLYNNKVEGRFLYPVVSFSSSTENLELYVLQAEGKPIKKTFAQVGVTT